MSFIKEEIEKRIWSIMKAIGKLFPKWLRVILIILILILIGIVFIPFLYPKYNEWRTNVDGMFNSEKLFSPDTIFLIDSISKGMVIEQEPIQQEKERIIKKEILHVNVKETKYTFNGDIRIYIQTIQDIPPLKIKGLVNGEELTVTKEIDNSQEIGNYLIRVLRLEKDFADFEITKKY